MVGEGIKQTHHNWVIFAKTLTYFYSFFSDTVFIYKPRQIKNTLQEWPFNMFFNTVEETICFLTNCGPRTLRVPEMFSGDLWGQNHFHNDNNIESFPEATWSR